MLHLLATLVLAPPAARAPDPCDLPARVAGELSFRGDTWAIRLQLDSLASADSALLDLPELVLSGMSVPAACNGDSLEFELPFGLGPVNVSRRSDGALSGVKVLAGDSLSTFLRPAGPPPYSIRPVEFRNGDVALRGSLYIPSGAGPHPALVVAHGSGPGGRASWGYRSWGDFFARLGIATLVYDKRGAGESSGDYGADSAFTALSGDLEAAVAMLRGRDDVDGERIGIVGHSQGAWLSYLVASRSPVGFLVLMAGPSVSVAAQEFQRVEYGMKQEGRLPAEIAQALAHTHLFFYTAVTGEGWEELRESSERLKGEEWAGWLQLPDSIQQLSWWRSHALVDPTGFLSNARLPILALYSAMDPVVPAVENAGRLRELLRDGHPASRVVSLPAGDHRLEVPAGRDQQGAWRFPRIQQDALAIMREWLAGVLRLTAGQH